MRLVIFLSLFTLCANAQSNLSGYDYKKLHFGFTVGTNNSVFKTYESKSTFTNDTLLTFLSKKGPGMQLGIVSDLRVNEHIALRFIPILLFSERSIEYKFTDPLQNSTKKVESSIIDLPLLFKFRSDRINNWRFYVIGGVKYWIDMSSQQDVNAEVLKLKTIRKGVAFEYGLGWDFYLPYFKFSPEIKFYQGVSNVLVDEKHIFSSSFDKLIPRGFIISFLFE